MVPSGLVGYHFVLTSEAVLNVAVAAVGRLEAVGREFVTSVKTDRYCGTELVMSRVNSAGGSVIRRSTTIRASGKHFAAGLAGSLYVDSLFPDDAIGRVPAFPIRIGTRRFVARPFS
ncbi:hypothetical protein [Halorhabdus rudnickae]|uniref:hypothetical protein n=1 Tax=Halorhabdus rudnickae TaxID=1775544 RepID=UPI00108477FA|nr:hypothetical protein [Halorhabdus rudnickae]